MICLQCDQYQTAAISAYGEWGADEIAVCLQMLKPGDYALDIGANIDDDFNYGFVLPELSKTKVSVIKSLSEGIF
jgi:hypothetical protein